MTQEEKAKAYDEAVNKIKPLYEQAKRDGNPIWSTYEYLIPELRESEDERMMREFNDWLCEEIECRTNDLRDEKDRRTLNMLCYVLTKVKDWLEKQKEQKHVKKEITLTNFEETLNTFLFDFANSSIEDCEPKEYIKKHSAEILKAAYTELNAQLKQDIFEAKQEGRYEGYEAAKAEQKPAEWSDEDEKMRNLAIEWAETMSGQFSFVDMDSTDFCKITTWLKSLRPSWKPSEEQMEALLWCVAHLGGADRRVLAELYEHLKMYCK